MFRPIKVVVWFSCGAASAIAARLAVNLSHAYPALIEVVILNNPILEEDEDNQRFLKDVSSWLCHPIQHATNSKYSNASAVEVWEKRRFMSGPQGAPCTQELKKRARQQWENENHFDLLVMGFTAEEIPRHQNFMLSERENLLPLLIDAKLTKLDCFKILKGEGINLPRIYSMGYPNANCIGCVKATSPTYWNHVRKMHPKEFQERADQSRRIGARLARYKNKRVFLDELPPDAQGRPMKSLKTPECGIFCEEK